MPVVDETGLPKRGRASCGVGRQDTGSAGEITNCQAGVSAACVSGTGHAPIDGRALSLPPKAWTGAPERLTAAAHVPDGTAFVATEPQPAAAMIARALAAAVPFARVAADSVYGVGGVERWRRAGPPRAACSARHGRASVLVPW